MSDEQNTKASELEEATASSESPADATTEENISLEDDSANESSNPSENVELDDKKPSPSKEEVRATTTANTIRSVEAKLLNGEEIPQAQKWVVEKGLVNPILVKDKEKLQPVKPLQTNDNFDAKIQAYEATKQFNVDKETFNSLPNTLKKEFKAEINSLKTSMDVSLEQATRYVMQQKASVIDEELGHAHNRKLGASLPKPGQTSNSSGGVTDVELSKMNKEDYAETMAKVESGKIKIQHTTTED